MVKFVGKVHSMESSLIKCQEDGSLWKITINDVGELITTKVE